MRKIPLFGRVATESDFTELQETQDVEIKEALANNDRLIKRALEDLGWRPVGETQDVGLSDLSPVNRRRTIRRAVTYWLEDPIVGNAVDLKTYYVFGRGLPVPRFENKDAQKVIDKFWKHPDNQLTLTSTEAQNQKSAELQLQGDVFFTIFSDDVKGDVVMSDLLVAEIEDIIVHPESRKKQLYYKRKVKIAKYNFAAEKYEVSDEVKTMWYADWRNVPLDADDDYVDYKPSSVQEGSVYHVAINRLSDGKFGNPRVKRVLEWARAYNEFMRARVALMEAASQLAWKRKVKGSDQFAIQKIASQAVQERFAAAGAFGSREDAPMPLAPRYGATITENENTTMDFVRTDTGSANAMNDGQMLKAQIGSGVGFPIHYFGDSSGSNLASATAMELPVMKMCEADQEMWEGIFRNVTDKVIETAIKGGVLKKPAIGKWSDIEGGTVVSGTLQENGYSDEWIEELLDGGFTVPVKEAGATGNTAPSASGGGAADIVVDPTTFPIEDLDTEPIDMKDVPGEQLYAYQLALPNILARQVTETINSVTNMMKTLDPNGENDQLMRWTFAYCLETLNVTNATQVMERIYPKGVPVKGGGRTPDRGPMRPLNSRPAISPNETGGPTHTWTPEDHAAAPTKEANTDNALLDEIKQTFQSTVQEIYTGLTDDMLNEAIVAQGAAAANG